MRSLEIENNIKSIFQPNRKCIVNTDLDGILSGMILQHFLNWDVVGYSSCCGKPNDELWLMDTNEDIKDCVFVDLPVSIREISVIDQHFVAFNDQSISEYESNDNKANPNIMRKRVFKNKSGICEYTSKYPFGTVHFILAVLENLHIIDSKFVFDFKRKINNFDLADLILRADRVIGNTNSYTANCIDWANWIIDIGGNNAKTLFEIVKNEYPTRKITERNVERKLIEIGCSGIDGDCSNLFRNKDYSKMRNYFSFLSDSIGLPTLPVFVVHDFNKLHGRRFEINNYQFDIVNNESKKNNVFSFAFVTMRALSLTYIEEEK